MKTFDVALTEDELSIIVGSMESDLEALKKKDLRCDKIEKMITRLKPIGKPKYEVIDVSFCGSLEHIVMGEAEVYTEAELWDNDTSLAEALSDVDFFDCSTGVNDIIAIQDDHGYNYIVRRVS
jgi:hypothetical protein